jgi:hypothetical protein
MFCAWLRHYFNENRTFVYDKLLEVVTKSPRERLQIAIGEILLIFLLLRDWCCLRFINVQTCSSHFADKPQLYFIFYNNPPLPNFQKEHQISLIYLFCRVGLELISELLWLILLFELQIRKLSFSVI